MGRPQITSSDTIAAVSTPPGEGGIGIVRLSGRDSLVIADRIFKPSGTGKASSFASHTICHGHVTTPDGKEVIDEVLITVMRAPRTYTAEDVIEINCHGGVISTKRVLELCLDEGARLAEPGEFTKRAFINGRIDLSQAEAVLDIIRSETEAFRKIAVGHLRGEFSREIRQWRDFMIETLSLIELGIDFPGEDVEFSSVKDITGRVKEAHSAIRGILETSEKGMVFREGASVVICGRPNVGKSSLMNVLLRHDRVIVTPVPGTTRDAVEESINIAGVKVRISDTAGIIETRDRVELEGIKRSKEKLAGADIVVFILDSSFPLSDKDEEIFSAVKDKRTVIVANKTDLSRKLDLEKARERFDSEEILEVSVLKKEGLEKIEDAIADRLFNGEVRMPEGPVVTNARHKRLLEEAFRCVNRAVKLTDESYNGELLASDLNEVSHYLGLIIGESVENDVLDRIFSNFCIGK
ncbi:MAG: tRNA uridine-5-carboxymethylaminomethyl(34) synthesis GTPase MnmE [Candidatus Omnitrophota bacterium]|nr:tRNA uridine-5-carboxymethylaminomethyl(34) synthesis GTPase MnmE [Candidatus Omnitrophota bacterium]